MLLPVHCYPLKMAFFYCACAVPRLMQHLYIHLQYLINAITALPVSVNELLTCLLKCDELCKRMSLQFLHFSQYTTTTPFSILQSINRYGFILNAYLPSEATRLKTSITFVARTMETLAPSIVLKTHVSIGT